LRKIRADELKEGMITTQTICDERGTILASNGVALTNSLIKRLKNFDVGFIYIQDEDDRKNNHEFTEDFLDIYDSIDAQRVIKLRENKDVIEDILFPVLAMPDVKMILGKCVQDERLFSHSLRVAIISLNMGLIKKYNRQKLTNLAIGAVLHDCGMDSFIEDDKEHPLAGYAQIYDKQTMDIEIALICLQHHERYNGSGMPFSFSRTQIAELAFLVAVVDYYDRLLIGGNDPRKAFFATIEKKGSYFDPEMTDLFSSTLDWARFYGIS
jgi:HD-GYP domain-containing protein (c-di-GMP phosphodiesterase class II)